jgi:hypothetical protein
MLIAGVMHVSLLFTHDGAGSAIGPAIFGLVYLGVGIDLFSRRRSGLWLGALVPVVGGVLGVLRSSAVWEDKFLMFHLAAYVVVVLICSFLLMRGRRTST